MVSCIKVPEGTLWTFGGNGLKKEPYHRSSLTWPVSEELAMGSMFSTPQPTVLVGDGFTQGVEPLLPPHGRRDCDSWITGNYPLVDSSGETDRRNKSTVDSFLLFEYGATLNLPACIQSYERYVADHSICVASLNPRRHRHSFALLVANQR